MTKTPDNGPVGAAEGDSLEREIIRAAPPRTHLRAKNDGDGEKKTEVLYGHFARFNEWTEIDSWFEGRFLERIAPGAFKKTFAEQRDELRVLFQHGRDPEVGNKPIASITDLREDGEGAYYEADLFDGLPTLILDGLRANQYGASFKMRVIREEVDAEPGKSTHNPDGIPERTIKEIRLYEFGPVTFPAYKNATAGLRSATDEFIFGWIARDPQRSRELLGASGDLRADVMRAAADTTTSSAPSGTDAAPQGTSDKERRDPGTTPTTPGHSALTDIPERRSALDV